MNQLEQKKHAVFLEKLEYDLRVLTSRVQLYNIAERLVGRNARKLELFGTKRNIRPRWLSE